MWFANAAKVSLSRSPSGLVERSDVTDHPRTVRARRFAATQDRRCRWIRQGELGGPGLPVAHRHGLPSVRWQISCGRSDGDDDLAQGAAGRQVPDGVAVRPRPAARRHVLAAGLEQLTSWCERERDRIEWVRPDAGALCCLRLRRDAFDDAHVAAFWDLLPHHALQLASGAWFGESERVFRLGFGYLPLDRLVPACPHCPRPWTTRAPWAVRGDSSGSARQARSVSASSTATGLSAMPAPGDRLVRRHARRRAALGAAPASSAGEQASGRRIRRPQRTIMLGCHWTVMVRSAGHERTDQRP